MKKTILLFILLFTLISCSKTEDNTKVKTQNEYDKDARSRLKRGDELIQTSVKKELEEINKSSTSIPKTKENEDWFKRADSLQQKKEYSRQYEFDSSKN